MLPAGILRRSLRRSLVVLRSGTFSGPFGVVLAETHHDLTQRSYGSESSNLAGHSKNPIVQQLWAARQEAKKRIKSDGIIAGQGKTPKESQVSICYPFRTDPNLLETYQNPWGQMRFGKMMEDLDAMAGVDRIRVGKRPNLEFPNDQYLTGQVTWTGRSSMEIRMQVQSESSDTQERTEWLEAYFTFVTLDPETKRPVPICPLLPQTDEEKAYWDAGAKRAATKKLARQQKSQATTSDKADVASKLLAEAAPLIRMPSLADPNSILMDQTAMQNAMIAQPQVRNLHGRIFGGFLMRRAFELGFATAYVFGGDKPQFLEVDGVSFESPVDIGDLLVFNSRVLYTMPEGGNLGKYFSNKDHEGRPLVMVEVEAWVTEPEHARARISNTFYFSYALPNKTTCRKVLPGNIDQAHRMAIRMAADEAQGEE
eukprot:scaffold8359_cov53-Attheya_sp.AAC.3